MKNSLISRNDLFLVQGARDLSTALAIAERWGKVKTNMAREINEKGAGADPDQDYTIYSYQSPTQIEAYTCDGGCHPGYHRIKPRLLGYKDESAKIKLLSILNLDDCKR